MKTKVLLIMVLLAARTCCAESDLPSQKKCTTISSWSVVQSAFHEASLYFLVVELNRLIDDLEFAKAIEVCDAALRLHSDCRFTEYFACRRDLLLRIEEGVRPVPVHGVDRGPESEYEFGDIEEWEELTRIRRQQSAAANSAQELPATKSESDSGACDEPPSISVDRRNEDGPAIVVGLNKDGRPSSGLDIDYSEP